MLHALISGGRVLSEVRVVISWQVYKIIVVSGSPDGKSRHHSANFPVSVILTSSRCCNL